MSEAQGALNGNQPLVELPRVDSKRFNLSSGVFTLGTSGRLSEWTLGASMGPLSNVLGVWHY